MKNIFAVTMLLASPLFGQEAPVGQAAKKAPDPKRVDAAIEKGIAYLKTQTGGLGGGYDGLELALLTFVHAGVPESDAHFQRLFKSMMETDLQRTYNVSLQAMILEEVDRVKYQDRLWQCAQFLVDNQAKTGEWGYGEPTVFPKDVPTGVPVKRDVSTTAKSKPQKGETVSEKRPKPPVRQKLTVRKQRDGVGHDNSNSQYAALGLRACHDAGIVLPKEVVERAQKWWRDTQLKEDASKKEAYPVRGWNYPNPGGGAYGSMTAGAVAALCIYDYILDEKQSWKKDPAVLSGLGWMAANFSVTENPGMSAFAHARTAYHYYLYGLERVGMLYGTDFIGRNNWYYEGAHVLLKEQKPDGSWFDTSGYPGWLSAWDTCWAILFLRRATRPLQDVASEDRSRLK